MKKHLILLSLLFAPLAWAAPNAPQLTDAQHDAAADAALIGKAQAAEAATQDAAADEALADKAKEQEKKEADDCAAIENLKAERTTCTTAAREGEKQSAHCKKVMACVPLTSIEVTEGEGEEQTPVPHAARAEAGYKAPADVKSAAVAPREEIRIGNADAAAETGLTAQPAVYKPGETAKASATPTDKALTPTKAVETKVSGAPKTTDTTRTPPAATGDPTKDREAAQATLKDPNLMTEAELGCAHGVTTNCRQTSDFGMRNGRMHNGVDFGATTPLKDGGPIFSSINGVVTKNKYDSGGYGNWVEVCNGPTCTRYGHLAVPSNLVPGSTVKAGEVIGVMGNTGGSRGTHLHYEVRYQGTPVNPISPQAVQMVSNARGGIAITHSNVAGTATAGGTGGGVYTNASYPSGGGTGGGVRVGGAEYAANFQYGNSMMGMPMGQGMMMGGMQIGGGAMGGPMGAAMGAVASALPVIILSDEQYAEFQETGELKLNERQNGQLPTNCKDQKVTAENADLLRAECTAEEDKDSVGV